MTREDKTAAIAELREELGSTAFFYLADSSTLSVAKINRFRRMCFEKGVKIKVAKNTLIQKALEGEPAEKGYQNLFEALHGPTTILISDNPKAPAKLIEEFRRSEARPILKAAYIDSDVFIGDDQLQTLIQLKTKDELVGEIIGLLQSPGRNLSSLITASGSKLAGIVKALEEREA
ncbi:MAG: 50S ribosomal protein L10 [Saprospirales bacterium]|jgi:large subunit ribosomal protein L10|nr:50S ribosomal protein L10 [Saprospirales bacterium]MBK8921476.1 50S ribosomal protein L10 [Saprospirales bacterium]